MGEMSTPLPISENAAGIELPWQTFFEFPFLTTLWRWQSRFDEEIYKFFSSLTHADERCQLTKDFEIFLSPVSTWSAQGRFDEGFWKNFCLHYTTAERNPIWPKIFDFSYLISLPRKKASFRKNIENISFFISPPRVWSANFQNLWEVFWKKGKKISRSTLMALRQTADTLSFEEML